MKLISSINFRRFIPIASWLPKYPRNFLRADVISGITVWGVVVPAAMAYAELAGLPPQAGLYAAFAGMFAYAIFATSRHLKVTASSTVAVMSAAIVSDLSVGASPERFAALSAMLAITVGGMILLAGVVKLGFISDFLSKPVITGFLFGVSLEIIVGQAPKLFGIPRGSGGIFNQASSLVLALGRTNVWTLGIGAGSLFLIFIMKRYARRIPAGLVALFAGILITVLFNLDQRGVSVVGSIPMALPSPALPLVSISDIPLLIASAGGLVFLAVGESVGTARAFAAKHDYEIDPDQELIALGAANLSAGLFQGFTVDASLSSTATAEEAGAKTQLSTIVSGIMIIVTIAILAPLFSQLPNAVLGAIIIYSVLGLLDLAALRRFYKEVRPDFWLSVIALFGVILTGVLAGLLIAVFLSVILVVYRVSRPYLVELGGIPSHPGEYSDLERHPENQRIPGLIIVRLDAPLFFANANVARTQILKLVEASDPPPKAVLFDIGSSSTLDISSIDMLRNLLESLETKQVQVSIAQPRGVVRDKLRVSGLMDLIGESHIYLSVDSGVRDFLSKHSTEAE
ncbi:MAG TPA: sulfate permease [Methylomirabilota bacterium]|nr:sulfate permease [Methylomirabilota bacterium]